MADIYKMGAGRPSQAMRDAGFVARHPYHKSQVGDLTQLFRDWGSVGGFYVSPGAANSADWGNLNTRYSAMRANLLVGVTRQCWAAKENIANAIKDQFAEAVIGPMVSKAQAAMDYAYQEVIAQEPLGTRNSEQWSQDNPAKSDAFKVGKGLINGQEEDIWWMQGRSRAVVFNNNKFHSFSMRRISYRFLAIDQDELDKVKDRPLGVTLGQDVQVAFPFYQRKAADHSKVKMFSESNPSPGPEGDKYHYCKIMKFPIHGRTEKSRDRRTGRPWNLWRAIEYGQVAGRYKRVLVKQVIYFEEVPAIEKTDRMRGNTKVAYASSVVTEDKWTVFMSPKWQWWSRQSVPINGDIVIKVDKSNNYQTGLAPIRTAVMRGSNQAEMKQLIARTLDSAMLGAGFRRG